MMARVYCYAGQKENAVTKAREVIAASDAFKLYKTQTLSNYNSIRYGEQIFGISVDKLFTVLDNNHMMMDLNGNNATTKDRFGTTGDMMVKVYEGITSDWRQNAVEFGWDESCLLYTSPSPRD